MPDYVEYFDLVAREVGRAGADTTAARQEIYEHVRQVQSLQLENLEWATVDRECKALERAILRIESLASEEPNIIGTWRALLTPGVIVVWNGPEEFEAPVGVWPQLLNSSRRMGETLLARVSSTLSQLTSRSRRLQQWKRRTFDAD